VTSTNDAELKELLTKEVNSLFPTSKSFATTPDTSAKREVIEPTGTHFVLQVTVLLLLTFCCYGVQVLVAAQGRADEERNEFLVRGEQLRSAGRIRSKTRSPSSTTSLTRSTNISPLKSRRRPSRSRSSARKSPRQTASSYRSWVTRS
jgi:hypothetical protein